MTKALHKLGSENLEDWSITFCKAPKEIRYWR